MLTAGDDGGSRAQAPRAKGVATRPPSPGTEAQVAPVYHRAICAKNAYSTPQNFGPWRRCLSSGSSRCSRQAAHRSSRPGRSVDMKATTEPGGSGVRPYVKIRSGGQNGSNTLVDPGLSGTREIVLPHELEAADSWFASLARSQRNSGVASPSECPAARYSARSWSKMGAAAIRSAAT